MTIALQQKIGTADVSRAITYPPYTTAEDVTNYLEQMRGDGSFVAFTDGAQMLTGHVTGDTFRVDHISALGVITPANLAVIIDHTQRLGLTMIEAASSNPAVIRQAQGVGFTAGGRDNQGRTQLFYRVK
jgi:hypothetical protein